MLRALINCAGINSSTPFLEMAEDEWDAVMDSQIRVDHARLPCLW